MTPQISVIIPVLNDHTECNSTIKSIRETAGDKPEIIVIDDGSQIPLTLDDASAKLIRNDHRIGAGAARHLGAQYASAPFLFFIDSHMRFEPGWHEAALKRIVGRPKSIHVCTCLGLSPSNMDMRRFEGEYNGAYFNFHGPHRGNMADIKFFEAVWNDPRNGDDYEIQAIMGASFLCPLDWFMHIGGLRLLRGYGYEEPTLSLRCWLAGGDIRIMKAVRVGHQFRQSAYRTENWILTYNRIMAIQTILPEPHRSQLMAKMPVNPETIMARNRMHEDWFLVTTERAYYESIFVHGFSWFLAYFKIPWNL